MLLAVDVGNAHTQLGLLRDGDVAAHWRVATDERRTSDDWAVVLRGLLGPRLDEVTGFAVCSTVPAVLMEWREMLDRHFSGLVAVIVGPGVRTGLPVQTDNPREVGSDRICNALAAAQIYGGPCIVVDFGGTATTFDVVDGKGAYVGGAIAPGIELALAGLGRRNAQLRAVELSRPRTVIARNTAEALQSGILFGAAAQVQGLVSRMIAELGADPADVDVIATGYLAPLVLDVMVDSAVFTEHAPWLTLLGLELVYLRNS
ncbi:MAG: type III pantothenate kinase [Nocardioides sp.]|uniref:type III pantothenate kinase n=1 Tax=Nocardioides sp. TaxID=35761 RepID=UPI0039E24FC4